VLSGTRNTLHNNNLFIIIIIIIIIRYKAVFVDETLSSYDIDLLCVYMCVLLLLQVYG